MIWGLDEFSRVLGPAFDLGSIFLATHVGPSEILDSKDFQLLAALYDNARQSYRSLGRRVSLSAPAVRDRVQGLESKGIIQGYWVQPDPAIFNRMDLLVFYQGERSREDAEKILRARDVAWVAWKVEGGFTVQVWPRKDSAPIDDITRILGESPMGQAWTEHPDRQPLSLAAWRIIDALIDQPKIELEGLCKSTRLSPKTVRKHLGKLIRDEAVYITPRLGALADSGELVYHLAVSGGPGLRELRGPLGDAVLVNETQKPPMKYLLCRASDLADVTTRTGLVAKLPGVESVRVTLNREILVAREFVHGLVREKIWEAERGKR